MRIECDNCGAKYSISDEKVAGKQSRFRCKKCGHNMLVDGTHLAVPSGHDEATRVFDAGGGYEGGAEGEAIWYVVIDGNQSGPMTADEVAGQLQAGTIDGETFAWREGMDDWLRLYDIAELSGLVGAPPAEEDESYGEEATRVVNTAPTEEEKPFSFASRAPAAESFSAAPIAPMPTPAPAPAPRDEFVSIAKPAAAIAPVAAPAIAPAAPVAASDASGEFTGQRRENSVLFSLADLTSTRTPAAKSDALPRTEGSGLIDIRLLAQSQASVGGGAAAAPGIPAAGGASTATRPMVPIVPLPARKSNTGLYVVLGIGGLVVVGLLGYIAILLSSSATPPPVAPVAATPAEASAPAAVAAAQPPAEPDAGAVVVTPDVAVAEPDVAAEASAAPPAEGTGTAVAAATPPTPAPTGTPAPRPAGERPAAATPRPSGEPAPTPAPSRNDTAPAPTPEPAPTPAPTERPTGSARDVIANIGTNPEPTPEPTPAAAPALSRSEVQSTMRRYRSQVQSCGSGATGTYRVSFRVQADGGVTGVSVDNGDAVGNCLVGVVGGMRFPVNDGQTGPITYPFNFGG